MQQVDQKVAPTPSATNATLAYAMEHSQLPVRVRIDTSRLRNGLIRNWVLYRTILIRLAGALMVALIVASALYVRDDISQGVASASNVLALQFAQTGFAINEIAITGQVMALESGITDALEIEAATNLFNFNVEAARLRVMELPAIIAVSIRKIYPSRLIVEVSEVEPVARWRVDGVTFVVDAGGTKIADAMGVDEKLPLVIGQGAADDAVEIIQAISVYPALKEGVFALSRIGDRRWDIIYSTGLRIRLPEQGVDIALKNLDTAHRDYQLLDRDLVLIDMRISGSMALRLAQRDAPPEHGS